MERAPIGIVVRNSIILVDFAETRIRQGVPLEQAVVDAGGGPFPADAPHRAGGDRGFGDDHLRPHLPGVGDLARRWRIASLLITRMAVPVLYALAWGREKPEQTEDVLPALRPTG